ncbi:unnamed protein product [Mytilus edulis]|uniref:Uncharacterized protein n=1 Tax=Mytilus edulis TaxID=6550 RepID=A0A8S3SKW2_MYTED|nr:unnamed protein product [Mytilus edulis]
MAEKELMTDMQKMAGMSTEEYESLNFYKYLCKKIGSEEVVKIRRLTTTMIDMGQTDIFKNITSGSKGEGLYFKSSDFDLMGIDPFFKKYTDEKFYTVLTTTEDTLNRFQKQELNLMKKEKLYTIYKTLTIFPLQFYYKSSIIPQELRVDLDVTNNHAKYHPIGFAYFLSFLCYYHRQDITSCRHFLQLLKSTITYPSLQANLVSHVHHCFVVLLISYWVRQTLLDKYFKCVPCLIQIIQPVQHQGYKVSSDTINVTKCHLTLTTLLRVS